MTIIICHGLCGSPNENWLPWLKQELEKLGQEVIVPQFPTPQGQSLKNWMAVLAGFDRHFNKDLIIIGHSIAPAMILEKLEHIDVKIRGAVLVAPFISKLNDPQFDVPNATFYKEHNWSKVQNNCRQFIIFQSKDDPFVPISRPEYIAHKLRVTPITINNGGHFNESAGFKQFPKLLEEVKKLL